MSCGNRNCCRCQCRPEPETDLLIAVHEVHEAVVVVVVVRALGRVNGQQQVVGPQAVALCVCVAEDARLQQLVVGVANACSGAGIRLG